MNFKSKILFCLFLVSLGFNTYKASAQTKESKNILNQLNDFYRLNKPDSLLSITSKALQDLKSRSSKDLSLIHI